MTVDAGLPVTQAGMSGKDTRLVGLPRWKAGRAHTRLPAAGEPPLGG